MEQRSNDATAKDVQTKPSEVEYVRGTGHISIHEGNLLLLDQKLKCKHYPITVILALL